jgi:hypothetical protein
LAGDPAIRLDAPAVADFASVGEIPATNHLYAGPANRYH